MNNYEDKVVAYWSIEHVRQAATETAIRRGTTLDDEVRRLLDFESDGGEQDEGVDSPVENFWRRVEDKLKGGNIRLVFVAEETSRELRRLVEFLNEKLDGVEVLAIEVKVIAHVAMPAAWSGEGPATARSAA